MTTLDGAIFMGFLLWMLLIGGICSTRMKNSPEMFIAGRQSPWWVSGLSGFMTIFSAGTFVVWGGIAYRLGLVAITILMVIGLSQFCIGMTVAPRWRRMGIRTPTEFLRIRFDESVVQLYTWLGMIYRGFRIGIGLYALAVMLNVLIPLPEGRPFRDPRSGALSFGMLGIVMAVVAACAEKQRMILIIFSPALFLGVVLMVVKLALSHASPPQKT
jgi:SSS family solute:Na+ symporter